MFIIEFIKRIIKLVLGPKSEADYDLYDWIEKHIKGIDPDPKLSIKRACLCQSVPFVFIDGNRYIVNIGRKYDGFDIELHAFQLAAKVVRMRMQNENPQMILFVPENIVGITIIDQRITESYFDNFDDKKETDASIFSWLMSIAFYFNDYPPEEIKKMTKINANDFAKTKINQKDKVIFA
ncbi:hypothetical protein M0Q50_00840 [bacterium]|nr:hypothetical protein [bacterium]